jgi:hypothetical protein
LHGSPVFLHKQDQLALEGQLLLTGQLMSHLLGQTLKKSFAVFYVIKGQICQLKTEQKTAKNSSL